MCSFSVTEIFQCAAHHCAGAEWWVRWTRCSSTSSPTRTSYTTGNRTQLTRTSCRCPSRACFSTVSSTLASRRRSSGTQSSGLYSMSRKPSSSQSLQRTSTHRWADVTVASTDRSLRTTPNDRDVYWRKTQANGRTIVHQSCSLDQSCD